ncbi:uncharacterized protein LOC133203571 [Saccostrea echinata]|uniref:uncharacterized protein LOC133203571 n=1 Tax=Saccostrea echinata TaxID=191078 RepID=UPI002A83BB21|nr:uncharacterized protein LOC133203571 [Saccostrea echinata]
MSKEGSDSRYSSILQNVWPPPNENTRARLERLRELENQRRQHESSNRPRSSSVERAPSSSRELLFGSRATFGRSSLRSSARRGREPMRAFPLGQANNPVNLPSDRRNESESRTVGDISNISATTGDVSPTTQQASNPQTEAPSVSTTNSEVKTENVELVIIENRECSAEKSESMSDDVSHSADQYKDTHRPDSNNQSMEQSVNVDSTAAAAPGTSTDSEDSGTVEQVNSGKSEKASSATDVSTVEQQPKPDTEIQISSGASWEVSDDTDKKLEEMTENQQTRLAKLQELEELRTRGRARERPEDSNLSARERFNVNYNPNIRPQRQLSIREQIRNSRRARRHHSDLQLSQHSPFLTETSTSSSTDVVREQTTSNAINPSAWDSAFSDNDRTERMKRLKELDKIRKEGRDSAAASSFDSDILSPRDRRNSAHSDHLSSLFSVSRVQPSFSTGGSLFPLSSNYSESLPSLATSNLSVETPMSSLFGRERNIFSSGPTLTRSTSLTTQEVIARAREVISNSVSASLAASSESDVRPSREEVNLHLDLSELPLTEERTEEEGVTTVDQIREARAESNPRVHDVPLDLNHKDGATCVKAMREAIDETYRNRYKSRGLPSEVADHFLADCFDPKYTFEERIVLIRKKLWGDPPVVKCERGHPDGASTESETNKNTEDSLNQPKTEEVKVT